MVVFIMDSMVNTTNGTTINIADKRTLGVTTDQDGHPAMWVSCPCGEITELVPQHRIGLEAPACSLQTCLRARQKAMVEWHRQGLSLKGMAYRAGIKTDTARHFARKYVTPIISGSQTLETLNPAPQDNYDDLERTTPQ